MFVVRMLLCLQVLAILTQFETYADSKCDIKKSLYDALYENNTDKIIKIVEKAKKELNGADFSYLLRPQYSLGPKIVALFIAVHRKNIEAAKQLVSLGADINDYCDCVEETDPPPEVNTTRYNYLLCSMLGMAAKKNSMEMVGFLLEKGATESKVMIIDTFKSAVHFAVDNNNADMIRLIAEHKGGIDVSTKQYFSPLFYAVRKGNIGMVEVLLKSGVNVTGRADWAEDFCALHGVVEAPENQEGITKLLLKYGANLEQKSEEGVTPLEWAFFAYNHRPSDLFIKYNMFPRLWDSDPALHLLQYSFNKARKERMEIKNIDIEEIPVQKLSAVDKALFFSSPWVALNLFIKLGANVNESCLVEAIKDRDWETARVLHSEKFKGSIKNVMSTLNLTFCHLAIIFRDLSSIESQNNTSEMIDLKDINGDAPIFIALGDKYYEGLKLLVEKGANLEVQNSKGRTASSFADYLYHKSIESIIKEGFPKGGRRFTAFE